MARCDFHWDSSSATEYVFYPLASGFINIHWQALRGGLINIKLPNLLRRNYTEREKAERVFFSFFFFHYSNVPRSYLSASMLSRLMASRDH